MVAHDGEARAPLPGGGEAGAPEGSPRRIFSRRGFLGGSAVVGSLLTVAAVTKMPPDRLIDALEGRPATPVREVPDVCPTCGPVVPDFTIAVARDVDMLLMDFLFYGFEIDTAASPHAITPYEYPNTVVVRFPPQAIGEAAYPQPNSNPGPTNEFMDPPPVLSQVAGPSQLAFTIPEGTTIPLPTMTADDLLDWSQWQLTAMPVAQVNGATLVDGPEGARRRAPRDRPKATRRRASPLSGDEYPLPSAPGPLDTAIEIPYGLFLSPTVYESGSSLFGFTSTFTTRSQLLTSPKNVTDLTLTTFEQAPIFEFGSHQEEISAIWCRDLSDTSGDDTPEDVILYGVPIT